jgi:hypothetical protein
VHEINDLISLVDTTLEKRNLLKNERANSWKHELYKQKYDSVHCY